MALGVILVTCLVVLCCSLSIGAAYSYPIPKTGTSPYDKYTLISSGRTVYNRGIDKSFKSDPKLCVENCDLDFTCKGIETWKKGTGIFAENYCLKYTDVPNPWITVPGYMFGKSTSNIFVKIS